MLQIKVSNVTLYGSSVQSKQFSKLYRKTLQKHITLKEPFFRMGVIHVNHGEAILDVC